MTQAIELTEIANCERCEQNPITHRIKSDILEMFICSLCALESNQYTGPMGKLILTPMWWM